MSPLIVALLALVLPLAAKDVPELEPFDDAAFDVAFERLRDPQARTDDASSPPVAPASLPLPAVRLPFVGALIKRLPGRRADDAV